MYPATDTLAGQGRHQGVESELQGPQYMGRDASPAACPLEETGQSTQVKSPSLYAPQASPSLFAMPS